MNVIDRQSTYKVSAVLAGVPFCVSGLMVGGALVQGLSLVEGLLAGAIGCAVLTVYAGCTGALGARTGQSTPQLLSGPFGQLGSKAVALVIAVCLVGWYSVQTEAFGQTIHLMYPETPLTSKGVASLWGGALMLTSAAFGFRGLAKLSVIAIPAIVVLTLAALAKVGVAGDIWATRPSRPGAFAEAITLVIGSFSIGATVNADITRHSKNVGAAWIATFVGFFAATLYIFACGAISQVGTGSYDLIAAMTQMGMGTFAFVTLVLSQWTTNDNNIYYASTSIESVVPRIHRALVVLAFGGLATVLAVAGGSGHFVQFLLWLGVLIPPVGGIILAHHFLDMRKQIVTAATTPFPLPALVGWLSGVAAGKLVSFGVASVNAIIAGALVYVLLRCLVPRVYVKVE